MQIVFMLIEKGYVLYRNAELDFVPPVGMSFTIAFDKDPANYVRCVKVVRQTYNLDESNFNTMTRQALNIINGQKDEAKLTINVKEEGDE